eukprot:2037013-Alexandrium_andersonii.AAC.1
MSASLVGSEMCIRDSSCTAPNRDTLLRPQAQVQPTPLAVEAGARRRGSVTSLSVILENAGRE